MFIQFIKKIKKTFIAKKIAFKYAQLNLEKI